MNICMFGASFLPRRGGMEYVIHHLGNALVSQGHRVTVIVERVAWQGIGVEHDYEIRRYGLPIRGLKTLGLYEPAALWAVWRAHRKQPFDLLHSHGVSWAGSRAAAVKRYLGIPVVMTPHGLDIQRVPEIGYGLRLDPGWNARIERNLDCADAVTAISLSVQNELDCVDSSKVVRIANGVHISDYGRASSQYLRHRLGLADDTVLLLSVGRNHIKKGYNFGVQTMAVLRDQYNIHNVHYVVVGKGASDHQALVSELGLGDAVSLIEEVPPDQVRECYRSADIFFSPSIIEGLSLVSIEALACGLPLVVTDVPGNEDIVRDTDAGLIVRTKNPESMAEGLQQLIIDVAQRKLLSDRAVEMSVQYDWQAIARQYVRVYEQVVAGEPVGY